MAALEAAPRESSEAVPRALAPEPKATPEDVADEAAKPEPASFGGAIGVLGRVFLVLGGAFLVRAITEAGALPLGVGVAGGLLYALAVLVAADRAAAHGDGFRAGALAVAAGLIVYPLLVESVTRFGALSAPAAATLLVAATGLFVAVAWRRSLAALAGLVTFAALGTGFALLVATRAVELFGAVFLVFGAGSLWLTYGRRWHALRWPAAVAADVAVLIATILAAWPGGPPEAYRSLAPMRVLALSLALVAVYLGSFGARLLMRHRSLNPFEVTQSVAVLLVGFGGASRVAHAVGSGERALGVAAVVAAAACYALALAFVERSAEAGPNFAFFTSVGLALLLLGAPLLVERGALGLAWGAAGLAGAYLARRLDRTVLRVHAALLLAAAAAASGLLELSRAALLGPPAEPWTPPPAAPVAVGVLAAISFALLGPTRSASRLARLPRLLVAVVAMLAASAFLVVSAARLLGLSGPPAAASLAALRTAVVGGAAVLVAASARFGDVLAELSALAYPIVVAAGAKLFLEDVPHGRPATLFFAFALYGLVLVLVPRLLSPRSAAPGSSRSRSS